MQEAPLSFGQIIKKNLFKIGLFGLAVAISFYIYTKRQTPVWLARVEIAVPNSSSSLGDVGALIGLNQDSPLQFLRGLFESRATRTQLSKVSGNYGQKASVPTIDKIYAVKAMVDTSQIFLEVRHQNQKYALGLLQAATEHVSLLDEQTASGVAIKKANAYEKALSEKRFEYEEASQQVVDFSNKAKTAPDPLNPFSGAAYKFRLGEIEQRLSGVVEQIASVKRQARNSADSAQELPTDIPIASGWQKRLTDLEYDLQVAQQTYGPTHPSIVKIKGQIRVTQDGFKQAVADYLRSVNNNASAGIAPLLVERDSLIVQRDYLRKMAAEAPKEAQVLEKLVNMAKAKGEVVMALTKQKEIASAESDVNRIGWAILGEPYIADEPINKSSAINGILGGMFGSFLGCVFFFFWERRRA
ncbi:MAG: hypothetical protein ABL949_00925 [Fimbriimonadaceae bacterium]